MTIRCARFRAVPWQVRCSVRHHEGEWYASVAERDGQKRTVTRYGDDAVAAMDAALCVADNMGFRGVDLYMEYSYEHPMHSAPSVVGCQPNKVSLS